MVPAGTTVTFYDSRIDAWHSVWLSPVQHVVRVFIGRKRGSEIVLNEQTSEKIRRNWIFSEIKPDSFKWRAERSSDGGRTWKLYEVMRIRRRGASR